MPYLNTQDQSFGHSIYVVREAHPDASIPDGADYGDYLWYAPVDKPSDTATQVAQEVVPTAVDGTLVQQWAMRDMTPYESEAKAAAEARIVGDKIELLWRAADRYTSGYISGVAIGILTIGVMQQKPKALAVSAWSSSVWTEYYRRKALVTVESVDDHDFRSFGPIPHSVPELQAEVGL